MREKILLLAFTFFFFLNVISIFALGQVGGTLKIYLSPGESNTTKYELWNNGNETITVSLRAEGDVLEYLSFTKAVELDANKITAVTIVAKIPADYSGPSEIDGYLYAVQEGKPGQVQLNVQTQKKIELHVSGVPESQITSPTTETPIEQINSANIQEESPSLLTSNIILLNNPAFLGSGVFLFALLIFVIIYMKIKGGENVERYSFK